MKKLLFVLVLLVVGVFFVLDEQNCLSLVEYQIGDLIMWDNQCEVSWDYLPKENVADSFSVARLQERRPYLLQFAGPFTDNDGSTQGVSFENGVIVEDDGDYYSGFVVVDKDGNLEIGDLKDIDNFREWIVRDRLSGFTQALMVNDGYLVEEVVDNWNLYKENRSFNYRFLVETGEGQVGLFDFDNVGLETALKMLVENNFEKAIYMDIAGSELGYFYVDGKYTTLGGFAVENRYDPNSPGGFLELRMN